MPNYTALEYTTILTDFRRRLEEMVSYAERVGAMPVLILPPANDAGFEPNRSFLPPTTPRDERDRVRARVSGRENERSSRPGGGDRALSSTRSPASPVSRKRTTDWAVLLEQAGLWDEAYREYVAARDLDGMPDALSEPVPAGLPRGGRAASAAS